MPRTKGDTERSQCKEVIWMELTEIKRKDLVRGDLFCHACPHESVPVDIALSDGYKSSEPSATDMVYRIELTDTSSDNFHTINAQLNRRIAHLTAMRDDHIAELEDKLAESKSELANRERQFNELDSTLEQRSAQVEKLITENANLAYELDRWKSTAEVLADKDLMAQIEESKKEWRRGKFMTLDDLIEDMGRFSTAESVSKSSPSIYDKTNNTISTQSTLKDRIAALESRIRELEEMHDIDERAWKKRESELLQMIAERDDHVEGDRIEELKHAIVASEKTIHNLHRCIDCITDEKQKIDVAFRDTINQRNRLKYQVECDATNLELLDAILKVINPLTRQPTSHLSREMQKLCDTVVTFRKAHNVVGASV